MKSLAPVFRWIPLLVLIAVLVIIFYFQLYQYVSYEMLEKHHQQLLQWTNQHYLLAVFIYMSVYIVAVAVSLPGASMITIGGGFLFGYVFGTVYTIVSATLGACVIFLAVKTALADWLEGIVRGWVRRMEQGFQKNAFSYLLFLRLVPLFPFWVINIVPGLLNVRLRTFIGATFLGIIPGTFVYVSLGSGLNELFQAGQVPDLAMILKPYLLIPLLGLAVLSLVPIIYRHLQKGK